MVFDDHVRDVDIVWHSLSKQLSGNPTEVKLEVGGQFCYRRMETSSELNLWKEDRLYEHLFHPTSCMPRCSRSLEGLLEVLTVVAATMCRRR